MPETARYILYAIIGLCAASNYVLWLRWKPDAMQWDMLPQHGDLTHERLIELEAAGWQLYVARHYGEADNISHIYVFRRPKGYKALHQAVPAVYKDVQ